MKIKNNHNKNGVVKNSNFSIVAQSEKETLLKPRSSYGIAIKSVISAIKRTNLYGKAIIFTVALGTVPVLAIGTFAYSVASQSQKKEIISEKQGKAYLLINNLNRFMQSRYEDIQILSNLTFLQNRKLRETITRKQMQTRLNNYLTIQNTYESIAVFDLNGNLMVESKGQLIPNQKNEDYFQTVLKTNTPYILKPYKLNYPTQSLYQPNVYPAHTKNPVNSVNPTKTV